MKITCAPDGFDFTSISSDLNILLYGRAKDSIMGSVGAMVKHDIYRKRLIPVEKAWDFLSIALSVVATDQAGHRRKSPDGWTREFDLTISVIDDIFWNQQKSLLEQLLKFLTTDIWSLNFISGGGIPEPHKKATYPENDCVALLSGGLDSFIGVIDLVKQNKMPFVVSQTVRGDGKNQKYFARALGGLSQFKTNHNAKVPRAETPASQRSRSIIFLAYGVLVASSLKKHNEGKQVNLYVCENGYISINPPITPARIGSLSTRTTHPVVFGLLQHILDNAGLNISIINPYQHKTKGEMLQECLDQPLLERLAHKTTSCGRFAVFKNTHCGRCVPCLVRRASFFHWKGKGFDQTVYKFDQLDRDDEQHAKFDDVWSMSMAVLSRREIGTDRWIGASLSSQLIKDKTLYQDTVERGLIEIEKFLTDDVGLI